MGFFNSLGNWVDQAGTALNLPEFNLSERIAGGSTTFTGITPQSRDAGQIAPSSTQSGVIKPFGTTWPVPTPNQPKNVPSSTPPIQSQGDFMQFYPGWERGAAEADFRSTFGGDFGRLASSKGGNGSGNGQINWNEIDQLYAPSMAALDSYENTLRTQDYPTQQNILTTSKAQQDTQLSNLAQDNETDVAKQTSKLGEQQRGAYAEALQMHNALQNQNMAMNGRGSSFGGAVSEILRVELLKNKGNILQSYNGAVQSLMEHSHETKRYISQKKIEIEDNFKNEMLRLNTEFQNRLNSISAQKGQVEAAKTSAKFTLVQEATQRAKQLSEEKSFMGLQLQTWASQQEAVLTKDFTNIKQEAAKLMAKDLSGTQLSYSKYGGGTETSTTAPARTYNINAKDEFSDLENPFA